MLYPLFLHQLLKSIVHYNIFLISFLMRVLPLFLSNLSAASCASYNFSFLSPQGLNFSSQSSSSPFWSGTSARETCCLPQAAGSPA